MPSTTGKSLAELKQMKSDLEAKGKEASNSKSLGKVIDAIKVLEPEKYGTKTVAAAQAKLDAAAIPTGQGATQPTSVTTSGDLTGALNSYQDSAFGIANSSPEKRMAEIKDMLAPSTAKPELLNRTQDYQDLRATYNVDSLESQANQISSDIEAEYAALRGQRAAERDKPVAQNVIEGRIGVEERTAMERIDALTRTQNAITNQLNTAYKVIEQVMNFKSLDYTDAVKAYEDEFNQNVAVYNMVHQEQKDNLDTAFKMQAVASSNLQIIQNMITSGNLSYNDLPDSQKTLVNKLEVQSGLPIGFTAGLKLSAKDRIIATSSDNGVITAIVQDGNGNLTTKTYGTPNGNGKEPSQFQTLINESNDARAALVAKSGADKKVSPDTYKSVRQLWVNSTGQTYEDFDNRFDSFVKGSQSDVSQYDLRNTKTGL